LKSGLKGYMGDEQLMRDYVLDDADNIYKGFVQSAIRGLIERDLVERQIESNADRSTTIYFRKTRRLRELCPQFMEYNLGNIDIVAPIQTSSNSL
ncbi:MAG TPA: hypothetical protein VH415_13010, partial [Nitrososphaeraceae archaeon]